MIIYVFHGCERERNKNKNGLLVLVIRVSCNISKAANSWFHTNRSSFLFNGLLENINILLAIFMTRARLHRQL